MNYLIMSMLTAVSLNIFGAAGRETALRSKEAMRPGALERLITVIPGPSETPTCIAYRLVGMSRIYACLVAGPKLNESISSNAAEVLVDALPTGFIGHFYLQGENSLRKNIVYEKILAGDVSEEIHSNALIAFFEFRAGKRRMPFIRINCFGPKQMRGRLYNALDKDLDESKASGAEKAQDVCLEHTEQYMDKSVGVKFVDYDLDVVLNYDVCMEYFPGQATAINDCSIL